LFYIVLRGLDTIEDDMTIPDDVKQPLLRSFHEKSVTPGWNFNGNGPNEKDRIVLVEYDVVVEELLRLEPVYVHVALSVGLKTEIPACRCRDTIIDICYKMQTGMADFAHRAALSSEPLALDTIEEYDLYCHYVAGLVGEGLSRLFSVTGKESPSLAHQLELSNSLGTFLQKTNIIRDFREDAEERRFFWPREIWGAAEYGPDGRTPPTCILQLLMEPQRAQWVQSAMVLDALRHACDALDYLRLIKNQSVFNFAAIPAMMAIATLDLCFMNPEMFKRNIKIRKAKAAEVCPFLPFPTYCVSLDIQLIMRSTNPRECALIFKSYARSIHAKASPSDPNFLRISVACAKIEHWAEHNYPSFVCVSPSSASSLGISFDSADARSRVAIADAEADKRAAEEKRRLEIRERTGSNGALAPSGPQSQGPPWEVLMFVGGAVFLILALSIGIVLAVLHFT
jgi:farnesyl-diphosphate farnesyltransferase